MNADEERSRLEEECTRLRKALWEACDIAQKLVDRPSSVGSFGDGERERLRALRVL